MRDLPLNILMRLAMLAVASAGCDIASLAGSVLPVAPVPTIPPATLTAAQNWPIVFSDNFTSNANSWNLSKTQPETNGSGTFRESMTPDSGSKEKEGEISITPFCAYGSAGREMKS